MSTRKCSDSPEAIALESSLRLYLKPACKIKVNVQLPKLKTLGQSISSYNVMEKLKSIVRPDDFIYLKTVKITPAVIKLEGELETKAACDRALARLKSSASIKIAGFSDWLHIRADHAPSSGPTRHDWEAFFRDAKGVNEMMPGERPDTLHVQDIPVEWFADYPKTVPSERLLHKAFASFGKIRRLEIPVPSKISETTIGKTSSLHSDSFFQAYIQYEEYVEFAIAMDAMRGKKLMYKDPDGKVFTSDIRVDFDRANYLSDRCIKQREYEMKKITSSVLKENEKTLSKADAQKEQSSEASPIMALNVEAASKVQPPVCEVVITQVVIKDEKVVEERKKARREAKRLLKELLLRAEKTEKDKEKSAASHHRRSSERALRKASEGKKRKSQDNSAHKTHKKQKDISRSNHNDSRTDTSATVVSQVTKTKEQLELEEKLRAERLLKQEKILKERLLRNLKRREEQKILNQREKLRKKLAGRNMLKSVLAVDNSNNFIKR